MNINLLPEEMINNIVDQANQRGLNVSINTEVEQALIAMLKITHLFKAEMDRELDFSLIFGSMEDEADHFYDLTSYKGMESGKNKINLKDLLLFHINIQDLLLHTLFAMNGSDYSSDKQTNDLEEIFDRIFQCVPKGREFDIELIRLLLLPIYNSTHDTDIHMNEVYHAYS